MCLGVTADVLHRLFQDDVQPKDIQYEAPVLLRLVALHAACVPLVLLVDEGQHAGTRDWALIQSVATMLNDHVSAVLHCHVS